MKILVLVKHVPDTEARIKIADNGNSIVQEGVSFVLNPYDEFALEEALALKEKAGSGEIVLISLGPEEATKTLRQGLAMGADRAVLITSEGVEKSDSLVTAKILSAAAKKEGFDLIFCGKQGVGGDSEAVGPMVAEMLDLPHVNVVHELRLEDGRIFAKRAIEGATEVWESPTPALITAQKGLNEPRYPSLKGIMAAKKKPLDVSSPEDLGLEPSLVGESGSKVSWVKLEPPPQRSGCKILEGEIDDVTTELVKYLHEERKII